MSDTPRTDAAEIISMHPNDLLGWPEGRKTGVVPKSKMKELERELAEAREQRDRLAEVIEKLIRLDDQMNDPDYEESGTYAGAYYCYYKGERGTWDNAREALAAMKGATQ